MSSKSFKERAMGIDLDGPDDDDGETAAPLRRPALPSPAASALTQESAARAATRPRSGANFVAASMFEHGALEKKVSDLQAELAHFEDAALVERLDPKVIRPSRYANRHELSFQDRDFLLLKDEIATAGRNVQPIKVRRLPEAIGEQLYEIVYGHRRHRATLELGFPVAAIVEDMSDTELFVEMERENRTRANLKPWEQAQMYQRGLDAGLYSSQRQMASQLGISQSGISQALSLSALPSYIVEAFPSPLDLQFRMGPTLGARVEADPEGMRALALEIASMSPRPSAKDVYSRLMGLAPEGGAGADALLGADGRRAGSVVVDSKGAVGIKIKAGSLSEAAVGELRDFITRLVARGG